MSAYGTFVYDREQDKVVCVKPATKYNPPEITESPRRVRTPEPPRPATVDDLKRLDESKELRTGLYL